MGIKQIKFLKRAKRFEEALVKLEGALAYQHECSNLWVLRGDLIQLLDRQDGPPLKEAASSYAKALKLDSNNLNALESLAHFYDAVEPNHTKAKYYAKRYIKKAIRSLAEMERIIKELPQFNKTGRR